MDAQSYEEDEQVSLRDRQIKQDTGLYVDAADFSDALYGNYEVSRDDIAALSPEDIARIAQIINNSCKANIASCLYESLFNYAQRF